MDKGILEYDRAQILHSQTYRIEVDIVILFRCEADFGETNADVNIVEISLKKLKRKKNLLLRTGLPSK